ncbi:MAG: transposase [Gemmatimonadota bacterium]|nr:transposase [Gemmatimonadota bacterium]
MHLRTEHRDNLVLARTRARNQLYAHLDAPRHVDRAAFRAAQGRQFLERLATAGDPAGDTRSTSCARASFVNSPTCARARQDDRDHRDRAQCPGTGGRTLAPQHTLGRRAHGYKLPAEAGQCRSPCLSRQVRCLRTGVALLEASSGDRRRHRLNRRGNRQLNCAIHIVAVNQRRWYPPARDLLARKIAEGKSRKEALRSLKRHLANVICRALQADVGRIAAALARAADVEVFSS